MTKNCPECATPNIDAANYCQSCGHKFIDLFTADQRIVEYHEMVNSDDQELKEELKMQISDFFMGYFENRYMRYEVDYVAAVYGVIAIKGKVSIDLDDEDAIHDFQKVYNAGMLDYEADVKAQTVAYMLSEPMKKMLMLIKNNISLESDEGFEVQRELRLLSKKNSSM